MAAALCSPYKIRALDRVSRRVRRQPSTSNQLIQAQTRAGVQWAGLRAGKRAGKGFRSTGSADEADRSAKSLQAIKVAGGKIRNMAIRSWRAFPSLLGPMHEAAGTRCRPRLTLPMTLHILGPSRRKSPDLHPSLCSDARRIQRNRRRAPRPRTSGRPRTSASNESRRTVDADHGRGRPATAVAPFPPESMLYPPSHPPDRDGQSSNVSLTASPTYVEEQARRRARRAGAWAARVMPILGGRCRGSIRNCVERSRVVCRWAGRQFRSGSGPSVRTNAGHRGGAITCGAGDEGWVQRPERPVAGPGARQRPFGVAVFFSRRYALVNSLSRLPSPRPSQRPDLLPTS